MHFHPSRLIAVLALLVVTTLVFAEKPSLPASGDCKDGQYKGRASGRVPYIKDPYTWAVTPEFARRFCMPKEFIDSTLKGAEAIAYWKKPSVDEWCRQVNGEERCIGGTRIGWSCMSARTRQFRSTTGRWASMCAIRSAVGTRLVFLRGRRI